MVGTIQRSPWGGARILLALALLAALGFTTLHVVRTAEDAIYWREHRDEPIQGWMTVGFVAHSYHVPPHVLLLALHLSLGPPPDKRNLASIAAARGQSVDQLAAILNNAVVHVRPPYPPPPPPPSKARP